jgi:hypothetical protein
MIIKFIRIGLVMLLFLNGFAVAEKAPFVVVEISELSIKLSNDGTGIIKDDGCIGCDFNFVKITKNSKATISGVEVNILEARSRAGKDVMVSFDPNTREVQFIRWSK